jgi:Transglutaminase-like superfamily
MRARLRPMAASLPNRSNAQFRHCRRPSPIMSTTLQAPRSTTSGQADAHPPVEAQRTPTLDIDCKLSYEVAGPAEFIFLIHALRGMGQRVQDEALEVSPPLPVHLHADPLLGHRHARLHAETGILQLRYRARVQPAPLAAPEGDEVAIAQLPDEVMKHLVSSRYCESDLLSGAAQKLFGTLPQGHARVQAVCDWIHEHVDYRIGSSQPTTTARDVFVQRAGVCRDFAHLAITFCRALNIPARLVVGYAIFDEPPTDFHAMFEAYLGGRWVLFDPTRMSALDQFVRIATGQDAKDVAFATIYGPAAMLSMDPQINLVN